MEIKELVYWVLTRLVNITVFVLHNVVVLIQLVHERYPQITSTVFTILASYIVYKLTIKMIKIWIRFVIQLVKLTLFFIFVLLCSCVYLRGFQRVFEQDVPLVYKSFNQENIQSLKLLYLLLPEMNLLSNKNQDGKGKVDFKSNLNVDVDQEYIDYYKRKMMPESDDDDDYDGKKGGKSFIEEKMEDLNDYINGHEAEVHNYLSEHGIDLNNLGGGFFERMNI